MSCKVSPEYPVLQKALHPAILRGFGKENVCIYVTLCLEFNGGFKIRILDGSSVKKV